MRALSKVFSLKVNRRRSFVSVRKWKFMFFFPYRLSFFLTLNNKIGSAKYAAFVKFVAPGTGISADWNVSFYVLFPSMFRFNSFFACSISLFLLFQFTFLCFFPYFCGYIHDFNSVPYNFSTCRCAWTCEMRKKIFIH